MISAYCITSCVLTLHTSQTLRGLPGRDGSGRMKEYFEGLMGMIVMSGGC